VNFCVDLFHSKIPNNESLVSNQYVPSAGVPDGASEEPVSSPKSASALTTYALFATPKNEYALCNPYLVHFHATDYCLNLCRTLGYQTFLLILFVM